jgi:hypothetical protein
MATKKKAASKSKLLSGGSGPEEPLPDLKGGGKGGGKSGGAGGKKKK